MCCFVFFVFIVNDWIFVARRMSTKDYTLQSPLMMLTATIKMPGWWRWRWWRWRRWRWSRLHTPSIGLHRGFLRGKMSPKCTWLLYGDQDKDGDERQSGQKCEMNISLKDTKIYSRIPSLYMSVRMKTMFTLNVFQGDIHIHMCVSVQCPKAHPSDKEPNRK